MRLKKINAGYKFRTQKPNFHPASVCLGVSADSRVKCSFQKLLKATGLPGAAEKAAVWMCGHLGVRGPGAGGGEAPSG